MWPKEERPSGSSATPSSRAAETEDTCDEAVAAFEETPRALLDLEGLGEIAMAVAVVEPLAHY